MKKKDHPGIKNIEKHKFKKGEQRARDAGKKGGEAVSIITEFKRKLQDPNYKKIDMEKLLLSLNLNFLKGNAAAIREVMARIDGPIPNSIQAEITGQIEVKPINISYGNGKIKKIK